MNLEMCRRTVRFLHRQCNNIIYKEQIAKMDMEKKGQVTLFILVAILIVAVVLSFFFWLKPTYLSDRTGGLGFEGCVDDALGQAVDELSVKGGFITPEFFYQYNGIDFPYLCYTNEFYVTCTIQKPFLRTHFQNQAEIVLKDKIEVCYSNSINELKAQGYDVREGEVDYQVLLEPGVARVEIEAPTSVGTQQFARFNVKLSSPIYDMLMISTSILQYETKYGDSDVSALMGYYPDIIIDKIKRSDGTTIYILEHKITGTKFQFASRSLAWPPGYVLE